MKNKSFATATSVLLVFFLARAASAGIVMAETSIATGPDGTTASQDKTIYVQGNRQKVETPNTVTITDLDRSTVYLIDKVHRVYTELSLDSLGSSQQSSTQIDAVELHRTGKTHVIANHPCSEYRANAADAIERITLSACVSTSVPGAKEISEFAQRMATELTGLKSPGAATDNASVVVLEKQSIVSFRMPESSRRNDYRTISLLTRTRVNEIQTKRLSPETFEPPRDFRELNQPKPVPSLPPNVPGQNIAASMTLQTATDNVLNVSEQFEPAGCRERFCYDSHRVVDANP
jgi:hypothetical protein